MAFVLTRPQVSSAGREVRPIIAAEAYEFMVSCPGCGTFETVWFTEEGLIVPTRKFSQYSAQIYHDCGTSQPCRLHRSW